MHGTYPMSRARTTRVSWAPMCVLSKNISEGVQARRVMY